MSHGLLALGAALILGLMMLPFMIAYNYYFRIWWRTYEAGSPVAITKLMSLTLHKVDAAIAAAAYADGRKSGVEISLDDLAVHMRAGGNPRRVVAMLKESRALGGDLTFARACEYDLQEHGVLE